MSLRDVVAQLVERVADGHLGGQLGDRESRWPWRPGLRSGRHAGSSRSPPRARFAGRRANCTLLPPVSTPTARITGRAWSRRRWYSLSVSVCAGATVMLSPVCTPMGSRFSIEQTTTKLSAPSRITSSSYSFQPDQRLFDQDGVHRAFRRPDSTFSSNSCGRKRCRRRCRPG